MRCDRQMTRAEIAAGICGFTTVVEARLAGDNECELAIQSACESIQQLAEVLKRVSPLQEISYRQGGPQVFRLAARYCRHPSCPVPVGIIKAIEVEAGLALPADTLIRLARAHQAGDRDDNTGWEER